MSAKWERLAADAARGRPRQPSRPRTKTRPAHAGAVPGMVTAVDRGRYLVRVDGRDVLAVQARELGPRGVVVGDEAHLVGDLTGADGALARIVRITPRRTELRRATEEGRGRERVIVAGADRMAIVASLAEPPPQPRLIDRQLVAAHAAGMDAILCLTKADLPGARARAAELTALYAPLGVAAAATGRDAEGRLTGVDGVAAALAGRVSVLVGHSGVGKSTLVNALIPGAERATGKVNDVTGKGRHTSSSAVALELPGGGWVIDTPGVRSFGLTHVSPEGLLAAFPDLAAAAEDCPAGCRHGADAAGCALEPLARGAADRASRLDSYRRIAASIAAN